MLLQTSLLNNISRKALLISVAAGAAAFNVSTAVAQDESEEAARQGFGLDTIVVTARKREENVQNTPVSIAAYTADSLKERQIDSSDQLTQITPNLQFSSQSPSSGNNASTQIFIRGIGQTEFLPSTDPGVGVYVDGVYFARSVGSLLDFVDLERIEILRGPQGTLFGRNTIGGAINLHTVKPQAEFGGSVEATVGSDDRREFIAHLNVPISDQLLSRISVGRRQRDGFVTRVAPPDGINFAASSVTFPIAETGEDLGDDDTWGVRGSFLWTPSENFDAYLTFDYVSEDENGSPQVFNSISPMLFASVASARAGCADITDLSDPNCANNQYDVGPFQTTGTYPTASSLEAWGVALTANWSLDWLNIKSITAYRDTEWFASRDADNTPFIILHTENDDTAEQFSQELQFSGQAMNDRLNWLIGLYYFEEEAFDDYFVEITFGQFNTGGEVKNTNKAAFAQATYNLTDKLALTGGLRYTTETKKFTPLQRTLTDYVFPIGPSETVPDPGAPGTFLYVHPLTGAMYPTLGGGGTAAVVPADVLFFSEVEREQEFDDVIFMGNVSYQWTPGFMTYFSYSEGFKSGGFNARNVKPLPDVAAFLPETAETFEVGFKSTLLDNSLRLNVAAFSTSYQDLQFIIREDFSPQTFNAGQARIRGFEVETTFVPTDAFELIGGVGYIDGDYQELSDALLMQPGIAFDNQLPHTPEWSANLGGAYRFDVSPTIGSLTTRLDWSYRSKMYFNANVTEAISQDAFSVFNAAVIWQPGDERFRVVGAVTNLTDKIYRVAGNSSLEASASYAESTYARPRQWSLSLEFDF